MGNNKIRLGINIDHVATVRNARGGKHPDVLRAALMVEEAGADGITIHLREDRRHIRDADVVAIKDNIKIPLNLEMAATEEMLEIACRIKPHACCLVPEKREELTTEGGLNVDGNKKYLREYIGKLAQAGIRVSLFIDPDEKQVRAAKDVGAPVVEIHTGSYCDATEDSRAEELQRIISAAKLTAELGIECHGGHGLNYDNVKAIAAIPQMKELNIGHFLIGEAILIGLKQSINRMREVIDSIK